MMVTALRSPTFFICDLSSRSAPGLHLRPWLPGRIRYCVPSRALPGRPQGSGRLRTRTTSGITPGAPPRREGVPIQPVHWMCP